MIDAHLHLWQLGRGDYRWITPERPVLCRDYGFEDFKAARKGSRVSGCVLVQAAPTIEETEFLVDLSEQHDEILGVTGWLDLASSHVKQTIEYLSLPKKLRAVRPMVDLKKPAWLSAPEFADGLKNLAGSRLKLEALVLPHNLPAVAQVASTHPDLDIVINHAAKPVPDDMPRWRQDINRLANLPNTFCKVSGLTQQSSDTDHHTQVFATLFDAFGPNRLMWGSDFPVLLETSGYRQWLDVTERLLDELTLTERVKIETQTAQRFYALPMQPLSVVNVLRPTAP